MGIFEGEDLLPAHILYACVHAQSCLTLCDPMDYSLPGFFIHGIFQARILEWVAISYSTILYKHLILQMRKQKWKLDDSVRGNTVTETVHTGQAP